MFDYILVCLSYLSNIACFVVSRLDVTINAAELMFWTYKDFLLKELWFFFS